ncbi:hypothetical protein LAUMK142_04658 [Mycobacterium pseudokansasii]|uniref:Uncharacterized protein n=1 Tax=Mycobacterium pseudokansasii TaxID=2341080 RepID=A0A498QYP3_9MYCO|nr:hypothetical protein LAUMK142_04658 [Mycobacterium pseudokansasii]
MVTVEADPVRVESRLAVGGIGCPTCRDGVLGKCGYARVRQIDGIGDPLRPRRGRCRSCAVTHVLLPVTVLLRRAYAAERIWAVVTARATGAGHRRIGAGLQIPAATVRGWLRRAGSRLETLRVCFVGVAVAAGMRLAAVVAIIASSGDRVGHGGHGHRGTPKDEQSADRELGNWPKRWPCQRLALTTAPLCYDVWDRGEGVRGHRDGAGGGWVFC